MPVIYDSKDPDGRATKGTAPSFMEKQVAPSDAGKVKTCRICGEEKPASEFVARRGSYANVCTDPACKAQADAMSRRNLPEKSTGRKPKAKPGQGRVTGTLNERIGTTPEALDAIIPEDPLKVALDGMLQDEGLDKRKTYIGTDGVKHTVSGKPKDAKAVADLVAACIEAGFKVKVVVSL